MYPIARWIMVFCLILATGKEAFGQVKPLNAVTESGGEVIFNCSGTAFRPNWIMSKDGSTTNQWVIAGSCVVVPGLENHYMTDPTRGPTVCNLIVISVTTEQAGVYWCNDGVAAPSYALLTVMDPIPVITSSSMTAAVEGESVTFTCVLNYNGSIAPTPTLRPYFYWTNSNGQNVASFSDSTTENMAISQLAVTAGRQNITSYTCHVYFQLNPPTTPNYASNTPTVNISATSSTIEVLYGPSTPVITNRPEYVTNSYVPCGISILTCFSTGNPVLSYTWYDSDGNVLGTTDTLTVIEIDRTYKCEAYNTIRNVLYNTSTDYIASGGSCSPIVECCDLESSAPPILSTKVATSIIIDPTPACGKGACNCGVTTAAATALGSILFISFLAHIVLLLFLVRKQRPKHDPFIRTENILQPDVLALSNGTPDLASYEELRRPTDIQPSTYEELRPRLPIYTNQ